MLSLAWMLATNPYASLRNGPEAVRLAERGWKIIGANDPHALGNSAAHADVGRFSEAVAAAERAIPMAHDDFAADQFRANLRLYQAGKPLRELRQ